MDTSFKNGSFKSSVSGKVLEYDPLQLRFFVQLWFIYCRNHSISVYYIEKLLCFPICVMVRKIHIKITSNIEQFVSFQRTFFKKKKTKWFYLTYLTINRIKVFLFFLSERTSIVKDLMWLLLLLRSGFTVKSSLNAYWQTAYN